MEDKELIVKHNEIILLYIIPILYYIVSYNKMNSKSDHFLLLNEQLFYFVSKN